MVPVAARGGESERARGTGGKRSWQERVASAPRGERTSGRDAHHCEEGHREEERDAEGGTANGAVGTVRREEDRRRRGRDAQSATRKGTVGEGRREEDVPEQERAGAWRHRDDGVRDRIGTGEGGGREGRREGRIGREARRARSGREDEAVGVGIARAAPPMVGEHSHPTSRRIDIRSTRAPLRSGTAR